MLDEKKIRDDFPILTSGVIYLDSCASSLTPEPVIEKMLEFYRMYRANTERGVYRFSQQASDEYERARAKTADFINAHQNEIIFTKNSTEAINIVANGLKWEKGDKIVTTMLEHHSNMIVWLRLKQKYGVEIIWIRPDKSGIIDLADVEKAVDDKTKLVAVAHASNVLGVILPVKDIANIAHERGALFLVDGAQTVPHIPFNVNEINPDFLVFSGHKMCGPTGSGVLYVKKEVQKNVEPCFIGGGTVSDVNLDYYTLKDFPYNFEAGTPSIAEAIGLSAATDYLKSIGMEKLKKHEEKLTEQIYNELSNISKIVVYGPEPKNKVGITSFNVEKLNPHDVALTLDVLANIAVRSGNHCAIPTVNEILNQPNGTVRVSTYLYNTTEEIDKLIATLKKISSNLG